MGIVVIQVFGFHPLKRSQHFRAPNGKRGLTVKTTQVHISSFVEGRSRLQNPVKKRDLRI
jgi:hypothetical protein